MACKAINLDAFRLFRSAQDAISRYARPARYPGTTVRTAFSFLLPFQGNGTVVELTCEEYQAIPIDERAPEDLALEMLAKEERWRRCPKVSHSPFLCVHSNITYTLTVWCNGRAQGEHSFADHIRLNRA
jgi:hypothetical protein